MWEYKMKLHELFKLLLLLFGIVQLGDALIHITSQRVFWLPIKLVVSKLLSEQLLTEALLLV